MENLNSDRLSHNADRRLSSGYAEVLFSCKEDELQGLIDTGHSLSKVLLSVRKDLRALLAKATKSTYCEAQRFPAPTTELRTANSNVQ